MKKIGGVYDIWKTGATAIYDILSLIYMLHVIDALVGCDDVWNLPNTFLQNKLDGI